MNPPKTNNYQSTDQSSIYGLRRQHRPDYVLVVISAIMLVIGLIVVYSISPALGLQKNVSDNYYVNKQLIAILLAIIAFIVAAALSPKNWRALAKPLVVAAIVSSLAVRLIGEEVNGAYRWVQIGGLSFQVAELIKLALIVWLANFLVQQKRLGYLNDWHKTFKPLLVVLGVIGFVVVYLQSDLGSAAVMIAIMGAMIFIIGIPIKKLVLALGVVLLILSAAIVTSPYRLERVKTFLNPTVDCQGSGYQSCQALIAVGSGSLVGLGLGRSVQAHGYLPEAGNDSIFAIYAEKFGFVGSTVLIGFLFFLFSRIAKVVERAPDDFSRLLAAGVLAWLSTQTIINIGAMVGLLPLKGITLPFISYGGTSLIFVAAAIGLVFHISRYTSYRGSVTQKGLAHEGTSGGRRQRGAHNPVVSRRP